jgi:polysaccharide biosynthesis protein PslJ
MRVIPGSVERGPIISPAIVVSALAVLGLTFFMALPLREVTLGVAATVVGAVAYRTLLSWSSLVALLLVVMLFIPVNRYVLPGHLPFEVEPYRVLFALIVLGWLTSLLIDPRVRLRRSGFEAPLAVFFAAILVSDVANPGRVASLSNDVGKSVTFFTSFFVVFFLIVSVVRKPEVVHLLVKVIVVGGSVVGVLAIYESRTGYNVFNHLTGIVPFIREHEVPLTQNRGARLRAYGSAEHAIALSALLVMLIPLSIYLQKRSGNRRWLAASFVLFAGSLSTVSRTGFVMLLVLLVVYLKLKPQDTKRLWPLILPALVVVHVAMPATIGPLVKSFFPRGGLIAEQEASAHTRGSGRIADLGPSLHEAKYHLLFGEGFGTRIVEWGRANAPILDDQWLGTLLETGLWGMFGLLWLFFRSIRRLGRAAKEDPSPRGWLLAGLAASITSFAVGMLTYDAFAFVQVTFVLFVLIALGAVTLALPGRFGSEPVGSR